jgi:hypothetical protein
LKVEIQVEVKMIFFMRPIKQAKRKHLRKIGSMEVREESNMEDGEESLAE